MNDDLMVNPDSVAQALMNAMVDIHYSSLVLPLTERSITWTHHNGKLLYIQLDVTR